MSGMIRRLRWKIVGISMLFVTLVLAAVFTGVMLTARSSLEQSSTRQLEKALRGEGYNGQNGQPCFVTEVYSSGTVRVMGSSYYQISEEDLLALVQECLSQQEESGLLTEEFAASLGHATGGAGGAAGVQLSALRCGCPAGGAGVAGAAALPVRRQP